MSLIYSLWYKSLNSNSSGVISDFLISVKSGQVVHVDVEDLMPSTQYVFILGVHDEEDTLFSDNITTTGITNSKYKYLYITFSIYHRSCLSLYNSLGRVDLTNCVNWFQLYLNPSTNQRKYFNHSVTYNPPIIWNWLSNIQSAVSQIFQMKSNNLPLSKGYPI